MEKAIYLAKFIISETRGITNANLQRMMYLVNLGYRYERDTFLIYEPFEAWSIGPVIPEVYWNYRHKGNNLIDYDYDQSYMIDYESAEIAVPIIHKYMGGTDKELFEEVSKSRGGWRKTYNENNIDVRKEIPYELMVKESKLYGEEIIEYYNIYGNAFIDLLDNVKLFANKCIDKINNNISVA